MSPAAGHAHPFAPPTAGDPPPQSAPSLLIGALTIGNGRPPNAASGHPRASAPPPSPPSTRAAPVPPPPHTTGAKHVHSGADVTHHSSPRGPLLIPTLRPYAPPPSTMVATLHCCTSCIITEMHELELEEISLQYVKPGNYIYVHGILSSYDKVDENGTCQLYYKVCVGVLNFLQQGNQSISSKQHDCSRIEETTVPTSAALDEQGASSSTESVVSF